jgi:hypothetical protein
MWMRLSVDDNRTVSGGMKEKRHEGKEAPYG